MILTNDVNYNHFYDKENADLLSKSYSTCEYDFVG